MPFSAEEIINYYKDRYGYVIDMDSIITLFKQDKSITYEEKNSLLLKILQWNIKVDRENKEKLKEFKQEVQEPKAIEKEEITIVPEKKESDIFDVTSYINSLKKCNDDDFLTEMLPSIYDSNYESIIGSILLYFFREISLANEMLKSEEDEEGKEYLKEVISRNKKIIEIIKQYNIEEEQEETPLETTDEQKNKLIFLRKSNSASLYIDSDIDEIAIEDDVLPILNDIINGNITREKRFHNDDELKGLSAIRRRDSRIIFVRLENNIILILGILVKRFQNPQTYRDMLKSRNKELKFQKESIKADIQDEEFIKENQITQEELIKKLKARKK